MEPSVGHLRPQNEREGEIPDLDMVRNKMQHGAQVFLGPEISELLGNQRTFFVLTYIILA